MYWLCYNNDPRAALIIYAAVAPDYDNVYGYDNRQDALDALNAALEAFYEWGE